MRIAETLRQAIRDFRFNWQGNTLQIGASIGIVEINSQTDGIAALLAAADMACYSAKDGGRNRVHVYDREHHGSRHREMQWVSRLTRASEEGRIELVFQPIVLLSRGTVAAHEAGHHVGRLDERHLLGRIQALDEGEAEQCHYYARDDVDCGLSIPCQPRFPEGPCDTEP